jgi:uncharacterized protein (TIGR03546 family)
MLIVKYIAKLIKILRSAATPGQIAGGLILGMIPGLTPIWSLHNLLVLFIIIILNVNISMAIFSFIVFSGIAYLFDPAFHNLGFFLLVDITSLKGFWTSIYNVPILGLSQFNNTVVMGSLVSSLILLIPLYYASKRGVIAYRVKIDPKFQKWKVVQAVKGSKIYSAYEKVSNWRS